MEPMQRIVKPVQFCSGESGEIGKKNYTFSLLPSFSEGKVI
jgi:hypothetical protein